MTSKRTILYVADDKAFHNAASGRLRAEGYEVVRTGSTRQAIALLFLNRKIEAVVIQPDGDGPADLKSARVLRSIRLDIPVILISGGAAKPGFADMRVGEDAEELLAALRLTLDATARIA